MPGQARRDITVLQAKATLATVRPRDLAGKTRRHTAADGLAALVSIEKKLKALPKDLTVMVRATGTTLTELPKSASSWPQGFSPRSTTNQVR
jgi:transposase